VLCLLHTSDNVNWVCHQDSMLLHRKEPSLLHSMDSSTLATIIPGIEAIRCMEIGTECFVEFMTGSSR
jgi:hypothetical protein